MDAPIMAAVKPISGENGAAIVILDGRVQIVAFDWKRDATMDMTMTKVIFLYSSTGCPQKLIHHFCLNLDGLIDCQDPECCESSVCKSSQLCATVARPIDILLQRQPPASTASFFQKMRFIIEEGSLQRYAKNTAFNERLVKNKKKPFSKTTAEYLDVPYYSIQKTNITTENPHTKL